MTMPNRPYGGYDNWGFQTRVGDNTQPPVVRPNDPLVGASASLSDKIGQLIDALGAVNNDASEQDNAEKKLGFASFFGSVYKRGNSIQSPLSIVLDTESRPVVDVWVKSSTTATFFVYGSVDGEVYRLTTSVSIPGPGEGEAHIGYSNAYKFNKIEVLNANDNQIEIVATR